MKKRIIPVLVGLLTLASLAGCVNLQLGGGTKPEAPKPTMGQQLLDLQKARDAGAITDAEYQAQKARLLGHN